MLILSLRQNATRPAYRSHPDCMSNIAYQRQHSPSRALVEGVVWGRCARGDFNGCLIVGLNGKPTNCAKLAKLQKFPGASEGPDSSSVGSMPKPHPWGLDRSAVADACHPLWPTQLREVDFHRMGPYP